jgi:hypothetical protein
MIHNLAHNMEKRAPNKFPVGSIYSKTSSANYTTILSNFPAIK